MVKKWVSAAALLLICLAVRMGSADVAWPESTDAQRQLKSYMETVNTYLIEQGEPGVNSLFEAYTGFEVFGITDQPGAEVPEEVEITARLFRNTINSLELRVSNPARFPRIAASFIQALSPRNITREDALKEPMKRMQRAAGAPDTSFEDQVESLNGTVPYIYYGYFPDQYSDGVNWLQMTIVFPLEGYGDVGQLITGTETTRGPDTYSDHSSDYEGYESKDDYVHYEVFLTATPEPDSAAAELDFRQP